MRLNELALVGTAVIAATGCGGDLEVSAQDADSRLRVFAVDYNAQSQRAVFEVCRVGPPNVGERGRVCQLGWANLSEQSDAVNLNPVVRRSGVQYTSAVFTPDGDAVYASRRGLADFQARLYDSPSEVVRIGLTDGVESVVAEDNTGLMSVVHVSVDENGQEALLILETLESSTPERPASGSKFRMLQVEAGVPVAGSDHEIDEVGSTGYKLTIGDLGYISQAEDRRATRAMAGFFAVRSSDVFAGAYRILPTLASAVDYVTGCNGDDCKSVTALRAQAVVRLMSEGDEPRPSSPERVIALFPALDGTSDRGDPRAYQLGYDFAGGAVATPLGPQPIPAQVPYVRMAGSEIPFTPRATGRIEIGAFARGWF